MELVDLCDENRIPLGKTAERYGHKEPGEYRTVVHVCIFAPDGRMLVQQRTSCKVIWPGRWDVSAAGGVDAGEDSRMAAERECREELGYPLDLTGVRATLSVNFPQGFDDFFLVERDVELKALKLQPEEVAQVRWVTLEEAEAMAADGRFIPYPEGFLRFLFSMRGKFGFPTK